MADAEKTRAVRDEAFWRRCFREHGPFLLRVVARLAGPGPHVDDIVQEAFLTAHRREGDLPATPALLRSWLYRTCANLALHHRRARGRRLSLWELLQGRLEELEPPPSPEQEIAAEERAQVVRQAVQLLPPKLREVFVLFELEDLSGVEIADLLDLPENTVRSRLRAARDRFCKSIRARVRDRDGGRRV